RNPLASLPTKSYYTTSHFPFHFHFFFFNDPATTEIYTLSLHDALPISRRYGARCTTAGARDRSRPARGGWRGGSAVSPAPPVARSEEHTSELQSRSDLVCRLLLEKKKYKISSVAAYRVKNEVYS